MKEICKSIIPPRKQPPCSAQSVEKLEESLNPKPSEPQAAKTENLAEGQRKIPLTKGLFAIVDDFNYEVLCKYNWSVSGTEKRRYAVRYKKESKKNVYMHREIVNANENKTIIDHINGNGLDNRIGNLRIVTKSENSRAFKLKKENSTSKYRGVFKPKSTQKWRARITLGGIDKHIGYYKTEIEAAMAYNKKAIELGFLPEALNRI